MFFRIVLILVTIVTIFHVQAAQKTAKEGFVQTLATINEYPDVIKFSAIPGTPFFSLSNQYDGAPGTDPEIPRGLKNYNEKTGLNIHGKFKTSQEFFEDKAKEMLSAKDKYNFPDARIQGIAMIIALREKFSVHFPELQKALLRTGNSNLIYVSDDKFWGGKGNKLGYYLEQIRTELMGDPKRKKSAHAKRKKGTLSTG